MFKRTLSNRLLFNTRHTYKGRLYSTTTTTTETDTTPPVNDSSSPLAEPTTIYTTGPITYETGDADLGVQNRLEQHYYNTMAHDLLIMNYNHKHAMENKYEPINLSTDLSTLFHKDTTKYYTKPSETNSTTNVSNLLSYLHCQVANKYEKKVWKRVIGNPIDYTPLTRKFTLTDVSEKDTNIGNNNKVVDNEQVVDPLIYNIPFLRKITLSIWADDAVKQKNVLFPAIMALSAISGKRAVPWHAQKGDANKQIRAGMPLGAKVTLTGSQMYTFLDKLKETVLPRLREWEGINPEIGKGGAVYITLPSAALGYFPDIEPHFDMYPKLFETKIALFTSTDGTMDSKIPNDFGRNIVEMVSGFGLPFHNRVPVVKKAHDEFDPNDPWAKFKKRGRKNNNVKKDSKVLVAKKKK